ncbi:MAG: CBS domain-containing protein [Bdellovibrionales bacterium]|jgi:acetoin utilization protein AcuB|nr:CBS domain-containing protein [Bdellovibrionales bacterium]
MKNLTIDEFTTVDPITVDPNSKLCKAKTLMIDNGIRHIPVVLNGKGIGIVSERSLHTLSDDVLENTLVSEVMVINPFTVQSNNMLKDVVFEMSSRKIGSALVNDREQNLYGIFTSVDALNTVIELL